MGNEIAKEMVRHNRKVNGEVAGKLHWKDATLTDYGDGAGEVVIPFTVVDTDYYNELKDCFLSDMWECVVGILKKKKLYPESELIAGINMTEDNKVRFVVAGLSPDEIKMYINARFNLLLWKFPKSE